MSCCANFLTRGIRSASRICCFLLLLSLSSTVFGQDAQPEQKGAATPEECVEQALTNMLDGNWEAFDRLTHCPTLLDQKLQRAVFRFASSGDRFRTKFIEKYGAEAWERFNDPNHLPYEEGAAAGGNGAIAVIEREEIAKLTQEAKQNATETESNTSIPNSTDRLKLIKRDGRWLVVSHSLFGNPSHEESLNLTNFLGNVAVEIERFEHAIGLEGVTPDDIDFEFGLASLKAMGIELPNANQRFDVESLPEPKPFEVIDKLAPLFTVDEETLERFMNSANEFGKTFLEKSPESFIRMLDPAVQGLVSSSEIQSLQDRVRSRWANEVQLLITDVKFDLETGYQFIGSFGTEQDPARLTAFSTGDQWIGIAIDGELFGIDTCNVTETTESQYDESERFFKRLVDGDAKGAYQILFDGAEPTGEEFENFAKGVPDGLKLLKKKRLGARLIGTTQGCRLRIMTLVEVQEGEATWWTRCLNIFESTSDGWDFIEYDSGDIGGEFLINDHSRAEAFLHALGNGDDGACMQLFHEEMQFEVQPIVFKAFCRDFSKSHGKFKSINQNHFLSKANFDDEAPGIYSMGKVQFENGNVTFDCRHLFDQIVAFNLTSEMEKPFFTQEIEDTNELDQFAQQFVELLLTRPSECLELTSPTLREELPEPEAWNEEIKSFLQRNGPPTAIKMTGSKFNEETGSLRFQYDVECEKRMLSGYVELSFNAVRCFVNEFSINADEKN